MFPMNQRAEDLLMGAPSEPTNEQLRELRAAGGAEGVRLRAACLESRRRVTPAP